MAPLETYSNQRAVQRLLSFPLVNSTCFLLSVVYYAAKENHSYVKSLCEVAESGVRSIASLVVPGITPILSRLQLQIDGANDLACKCLDKAEEAFPILHQPLTQVITSPDCVLATARNGRVAMVDGAKHTLSAVLSKASVILQEAMGFTKAVANGSMKTMSSSHVAQFFSARVKAVLIMCERLLYPKPDLPEEQLGKANRNVDVCKTSSKKQYMFLNSMSSRLWKNPTSQYAAGDQVSEVESCTLLAPSRFTSPLQTMDFTMVTSIQGFFQSIQICVLTFICSASKVCHNFKMSYSNRAHSD